MGAPRRNEGPRLREHDDERVLPEELRFTRHIRAGDNEDTRALARSSIPELAMIADEACAVSASQILLEHGVAPVFDIEHERAVDLGTHIVLLDRQLGKAGIVVEIG